MIRQICRLSGFVFDIDGVLVRGSRPIPQAHDALALLNRKNVPFILLTNGGGVSEAARVKFLSAKLDIPLSPLQIVQSHTPMKAWAAKHEKILVVGGERDDARHVALGYGFKDVVVPMDLVKAHPLVSPHHRFATADLERYARKVSDRPFDAVLVFNDPRDMATDVQIVSDLLNSCGGRFGTRRSDRLPKPAVPIVFSNNDWVWANDYPLPRYGQGAFRMIIEQLYLAENGHALERLILGKPNVLQHHYAHHALLAWLGHATSGLLFEEPKYSPMDHIYMVGDNPALDIAGARAAGWELMLLRSGVYKDGVPAFAPSVGVFDNVYDAVALVV